MRITPIYRDFSNKNYTRSLRNFGILEKLPKPADKKETAVLACFAALGAATALLVKSYYDNRTSKDINHPVVQLIKENPRRTRYIETLHKYPKLSDEYYKILENSSSNNEDAISAKNILNVFEIILEGLTNQNYKNQKDSILKSLEDNYSNDLHNICIDFYCNGKNGGSINDFFECISNKKISSEELNDWTKYPQFDIKKYLMVKDAKPRVKNHLNNLLSNGKIEYFKIDKGKTDDTSYFFKLKFKEDIPVEERKKLIIRTHEALYGPIRLQIKEKNYSSGYCAEDIENELYERLQKDKTLDALYNLLKFINPDSLSKYDYTSKQVKYLHWEGDTYKQLRKDLGAAIIDINFKKSPQIKELIELMNNKELFSGISDNCHAVLRVISRIILKDNYSPDLLSDSKTIMEELNNEIERKFMDVLPVFRYKYTNGCAPSFYLGKTPLGEYLKITLNKKGEIHTIFEDVRRTNLADILIKSSTQQT